MRFDYAMGRGWFRSCEASGLGRIHRAHRRIDDDPCERKPNLMRNASDFK